MKKNITVHCNLLNTSSAFELIELLKRKEINLVNMMMAGRRIGRQRRMAYNVNKRNKCYFCVIFS